MPLCERERGEVDKKILTDLVATKELGSPIFWEADMGNLISFVLEDEQSSREQGPDSTKELIDRIDDDTEEEERLALRDMQVGHNKEAKVGVMCPIKYFKILTTHFLERRKENYYSTAHGDETKEVLIDRVVFRPGFEIETEMHDTAKNGTTAQETVVQNHVVEGQAQEPRQHIVSRGRDDQKHGVAGC